MALSQDAQMFDQLRQELADVRLHFDSWVAEQRRLLAEGKRNHQLAMNEEKENVAAVRRTHDVLCQKEAASQRILEKERAELSRAESEASELGARFQATSNIKSSLQASIDALKAQIQQEEAAIAELKASRENESGEAKRALKLYATRTGLRLEKNKETGAINFVFTQIDRSRPDAEYSLSLIVDASGRYVFAGCAPLVSGLDGAALDELNRTNDLSKYLKNARRIFIDKASVF